MKLNKYDSLSDFGKSIPKECEEFQRKMLMAQFKEYQEFKKEEQDACKQTIFLLKSPLSISILWYKLDSSRDYYPTVVEFDCNGSVEFDKDRSILFIRVAEIKTTSSAAAKASQQLILRAGILEKIAVNLYFPKQIVKQGIIFYTEGGEIQLNSKKDMYFTPVRIAI